jgi:glycosyltransferase involved in cell wall biosynthesis
LRILGLISKGYARDPEKRTSPRGGAQISHLELMSELALRNRHRCLLLTAFSAKQSAQFSGVAIRTYRDREEMWQLAEAFRPDAVLAALEPSYDAIRLAQFFGIPGLLFLHSYEASPFSPEQQERYGVSGLESTLSTEQWDFCWSHAARLYACSAHLKDWMAQRGRKLSGVLYPAFSSARTLVRRASCSPDGFITGICGYRYKGGNIFLELARAFPQQRFQLFGPIESGLSESLREQPNITLRPHAGLHQVLADAKAVLVPSQWPEPFGRIAVEAMINGIPVLASAAGGLREAAAPKQLVNRYHDPDAWTARLSELLDSAAARSANEAAGRKWGQPFLNGRTARQVDRDLRRLVASRAGRKRGTAVVALCGGRAAKTAFALANSQLEAFARPTQSARMVTLPEPLAFCPERIRTIVQHDYSRDFKSVEFADEGRVVAIRTWDFGAYPPAWVQRINREVDQLWVHSCWVRDNAVRSGIPASRVRTIPLGVDERIFRPGGGKAQLQTRKRFRFLFVGRTVLRKGIDTLLAAYGKAFTPQDDVCLVIKDHTADTFYRGIDLRREILDFAQDPSRPELLYLDRYFDPAALTALYRSCTVTVFPYRAEGFCLPILEGMACGLPPIVPSFGASLDFCSPDRAFLVPAKRISLPVSRVLQINTLGFEEHVDEVEFCEVPVDVLAEILRSVYELQTSEIHRRGAAASQLARSRFRWRDTVASMQKALDEVGRRRVPVRLRNRRRLFQENLAKFDIAKDLFLNQFRK